MDKRFYQKYLQRSKIRTLEPFAPAGKISGAVVIPALAEYDFLPETLSCLAKCKAVSSSTIIVIVINSSAETSVEKVVENAKTMAALQAGDKEFCGGLEIGKKLFWIDATSQGKQISAKGGVGEARKIGMDSCLELFEQESLKKKLFFCLDADTLVSENYLSATYDYFQKHIKTYAATMNFAHRSGKTAIEHAAIESYESFMRYYVRGLKFAGSPYAFYALGSAIICRVEAYIRAGGMRARNGGEDFYFMQAVSKFGHCGVIKDALVRPSARPSDRVPFGTGPKVREIVDGHELLFYNPEIFKNLKILLDTVNNLTKPEAFRDLATILSAHCGEETMEFLNKYNFEMVWEKVFQNTRHQTIYLKKAFHTWFDAFRTLKFIHFCENKYPRVNSHEVMNKILEY